MKYKNQGFTLIELLVVIALIGILSTISLGSGKLFESSWKFELENKEIIKLIQDARVNALTAKTCGDRTKAAKKWRVVIEPKKITLQCLHDNYDPDTDKDIDSVGIKYSNFKYYLNNADSLDMPSDLKIIISFFTVSTEQQSKIILGSAEYDKIRLVFTSTLSEGQTKNTICYSRLGGFASFNYGDKCAE